MIINEWAGSGGDAFPYSFRKAGLGPLVGKRTWGGLVGISGNPMFIDGGFITAPNLAIWHPDGYWDVEGYGVDPDIEVMGTLESVSASIQWFEENPLPDLLMLDIQLADGLSFDIFKQVKIDSFVIFTTAYDEYAIKAFDLNSIDLPYGGHYTISGTLYYAQEV